MFCMLTKRRRQWLQLIHIGVGSGFCVGIGSLGFCVGIGLLGFCVGIGSLGFCVGIGSLGFCIAMVVAGTITLLNPCI